MEKAEFIKCVEQSVSRLIQYKLYVEQCDDGKSISFDRFDLLVDCFNKRKKIIEKQNISPNHIALFHAELVTVLNEYRISYSPIEPPSFIDKHQVIDSYKIKNDELERQISKLEFSYSFFEKLGFFVDNIVAIGANGSGKTTLSDHLRKYLPSQGVVIGAQKILIIPTFSGISNSNNTTEALNKSRNIDKGLKSTYPSSESNGLYHIVMNIGGEFKTLLDNLLAERNAARNKWFEETEDGLNDANLKRPTSNLDLVFIIWNSLITHRTISCEDGTNINISAQNIAPYGAHQMSDGEKVILYHIAQVLQAPQDGFIIVDEPEMYLHKTILNKLWDKLEMQRKDCIFIYLTHDLDFAVSRNTPKKVWISSFTHPDQWTIEQISENELPSELLYKLLGSRNPILFCEGKNKKSLDEKIYNILLPQFTITPVETCSDVINYTRAFNKIPNITTKAYGLIDSDHRESKQLEKLESENIFTFSVAEVENLLLDESFLNDLAASLSIEGEDKTLAIETIKNSVIQELNRCKEQQVSNYVSSKITFYFKDSHVSNGNTQKEIQDNLRSFTGCISIEKWYSDRMIKIEEIIKQADYQKAISVFNHKGLSSFANQNLKITDFTYRAIKLLQKENKTHADLLSYFPTKLKDALKQ